MNNTTYNLIEAIEENIPLKIDSKIFINNLSISDDGIFSTAAEWLDFIDSLELNDIDLIIKEHIAYEDLSVSISLLDFNLIKVTTKEPISLVTGFQIINNHKQDIISKVTELVLSVDWEAYFSANNRKLLPENNRFYATDVDFIGSFVDIYN